MFVLHRTRRKRLHFGAVVAGLSVSIEGMWARSRWARAPLFPFRQPGAFAGKALRPGYRTGHSREQDNGCHTKRYPCRLACFPLSAPPVLFLSSFVFAPFFSLSYSPGATDEPFFTPSLIFASLHNATPRFSNRLIFRVLIGKIHLRRLSTSAYVDD